MPYSAARIIRDAWRRSGLTQRDFANKLDISRSSLQRYMAGESKANAKSKITDARIIAYSERHSKGAAERFAYKMRERQRGRSVRVGSKEIIGDEAVKIKKTYAAVNKVREGLGFRPISPRGFHGNIDNLISVLERQLDSNYLEQTRKRGREGFKSSLAAMIERTGDFRAADNIKRKLDALSGIQLDRLYEDNKGRFDAIFEDSDSNRVNSREIIAAIDEIIDLSVHN